MGSPIQELGPIRAHVNVYVVATDVVIDIDVHVGAVLIDVHVSAVPVYVYVDIYIGEKFPAGTRVKKSRDTADVDISAVAAVIDTDGLVDPLFCCWCCCRLG